MTDQEKAQVIIREVCKYLDVSEKKIKEPIRKREIVECRQFAMYYIRKNTSMSLESIGKIFKKDHATVLNALHVAENLINFNGYKQKDGRMRFMIDKELYLSEYNWAEKIAQL